MAINFLVSVPTHGVVLNNRFFELLKQAEAIPYREGIDPALNNGRRQVAFDAHYSGLIFGYRMIDCFERGGANSLDVHYHDRAIFPDSIALDAPSGQGPRLYVTLPGIRISPEVLRRLECRAQDMDIADKAILLQTTYGGALNELIVTDRQAAEKNVAYSVPVMASRIIRSEKEMIMLGSSASGYNAPQ